MKSAFFIMAQHGDKALMPLAEVARDCELLRKIDAGKIALSAVRIEASQKAARGVHISDFAAWVDARVEAPRKERQQFAGVVYAPPKAGPAVRPMRAA